MYNPPSIFSLGHSLRHSLRRKHFLFYILVLQNLKAQKCNKNNFCANKKFSKKFSSQKNCQVKTIIFISRNAPNDYFWAIYGRFKMPFFIIFWLFFDFLGLFLHHFLTFNGGIMVYYDFLDTLEGLKAIQGTLKCSKCHKTAQNSPPNNLKIYLQNAHFLTIFVHFSSIFAFWWWNNWIFWFFWHFWIIYIPRNGR